MWHWHFRGRTYKGTKSHCHPGGHLWHEHEREGLFEYGRTRESLKRKR